MRIITTIKNNTILRIIILIAILALAVVSSFFFGRYNIDFDKVVSIILSRFIPVEQSWTAIEESVIWDVRIPRILVALFAGAGLAAAGCSYQGVFRNPLVSPDILGVSAAAGFGAALSIILVGTTGPLTTVMAFVFGIAGVAISYALGRRNGQVLVVSLVLGGMIVQSLFSAGISALKYIADTENELPAITFWLMGSLSAVDWADVALCLPVVAVSCAVLCALGQRINVLTFGDSQAQSMGLNVKRLRAVIIVAATVCSAATVCVCGTIGWIGLVIPHAARLLVGPDYRKSLPTSIVLGGAFLLFIDNLTRTVSAASLPLSILMAFVGAPVFAVLLRRSKSGVL